MLAAGRYLWNAGIFLMSVSTARAAFETHAPGLLGPVGGRCAATRRPIWGSCGWMRRTGREAEEISIDYAVMERASNLQVVPFDGAWSDLGDWASVWRETGPDEGGLVTHGPVTAIDCADSLLRSEVRGAGAGGDRAARPDGGGDAGCGAGGGPVPRRRR